MKARRTAKRLQKVILRQKKGKPKMAQQNSPQTRSNPNQATSVSALDHESSPKNDALNDALFFIAIGSNINPYDLAKAGFSMREFGFYPSNFNEVCQRLRGFTVSDESVNKKKVYRIEI